MDTNDKKPETPGREAPAVNWYPGHMAKALREIKEKLRLVDIVFEIRDARVPLGSGNPALDDVLSQKSRLIILNKSNLSDPSLVKQWDAWFQKRGQAHLFVNGMDPVAIKKAIVMARTIVEKKHKDSNPDKAKKEKKKFKVMVIGLPNTGKSTIINQLAGKNAAKTADHPGQTQQQQWIKIDSGKLQDLELLDTPGVMPPHISSQQTGVWLSMIHALPDDVLGEEATATFLVKFLVKHKSAPFFERYKLTGEESGHIEIFEKIAVLRGCLRQKGLFDLERVYKLVLYEFRKGDLGHWCFELPPRA